MKSKDFDVASASVVSSSEKAAPKESGVDFEGKVAQIKGNLPALSSELVAWVNESLKVTGHRAIGRALAEKIRGK